MRCRVLVCVIIAVFVIVIALGITASVTSSVTIITRRSHIVYHERRHTLSHRRQVASFITLSSSTTNP